jgi:hypothetical protein
MVGMTKVNYRKLRAKKKKKEKESAKVGIIDYILALVNVALLFPVVWVLSNVVADIIRFILKILNEVT